MPYTKVDLIGRYNLSLEEVDSTLSAYGLSTDRDDYTDEEIQSGFDIIRGYFNDGRTSDYAEAAELFKQHLTQQQNGSDSQSKPKKTAKGKKLSNKENGTAPDHLLEISELLALASEQCDQRITLKEAALILDSCGLPDTEHYTSFQGDRFLEACDLIKKQNLSYEEVAAHFGGENTSSSDLQSQLQQIVAKFSSSATTAESELLELASRIAKKQVNATDIDIDQLMRRLYLIELSQKAAKQRDKNDTIFAEIEQRVLDQIEGKSPVRSLQAIWDRQMNSLPPSSAKPMILPEESDNGTTAS